MPQKFKFDSPILSILNIFFLNVWNKYDLVLPAPEVTLSKGVK